MASAISPPPTYADVVIVDQETKQGKFNPIWLRWFLDLAQQTNTAVGTVTSVNVAGGTTGLTFSGGPITTTGTITMAGTLAPGSGGMTYPGAGIAVSTGAAWTTSIAVPVPVASGGTGSATQNWVDLTTNQATIAGIKTFTTNLNLVSSTPEAGAIGTGWGEYTYGLSAITDRNSVASGFTNGQFVIMGSGTVTAGSFIVGKKYTILTLGSTDFTLIGAAGAPPGTVGTDFIATGVGTGSGTASLIGGRVAFTAAMIQSAASSINNNNRNYVGVVALCSGQAGDGGTGVGSEKGGYFGMNPVVSTAAGTYSLNVSGLEVDTFCQSYTTTWYHSGVQFTPLDHTGRGYGIDAAVVVSNGLTGTAGWRHGILFGSMNGYPAFTQSATWVGESDPAIDKAAAAAAAAVGSGSSAIAAWGNPSTADARENVWYVLDCRMFNAKVALLGGRNITITDGTISGCSSISSTAFTGALTGNASTSTTAAACSGNSATATLAVKATNLDDAVSSGAHIYGITGGGQLGTKNATFPGNDKPGANNQSVVWLNLKIDGSNFWLPAWAD